MRTFQALAVLCLLATAPDAAAQSRDVPQPRREQEQLVWLRSEGPGAALATWSRLVSVLDANHDETLDGFEISAASEQLMKLDTNQDGHLASEEWKPRFAGFRGPWDGNRARPTRSDSVAAEIPTSLRRFKEQIMDQDLSRDGEVGQGELSASLASLIVGIDKNQSGGLDAHEAEQLYQTVSGLRESRQLIDAILSTDGTDSSSLEKVRALLKEQEAIESEIQSHIVGRKRIQALLYCFTVGAMFLSVAGFGHLLTNPPEQQTGWREVLDDPTARKSVIYSVAFIAGLSGIDLVWTMLASGNSHFIELNPFGVELLGDSSIAIFKLITLALTVFMFLRLRQFRGAQVGSWWMCLICTLVTWRWLLTKSMFIE